MKFICDNCKAKYQIGDDKIAGRSVRMKCRRCGHLIQLATNVTGDAGAHETGAHEAAGAHDTNDAPALAPVESSSSASVALAELLAAAASDEDGPTRAMPLEQRAAPRPAGLAAPAAVSGGPAQVGRGPGGAPARPLGAPAPGVSPPGAVAPARPLGAPAPGVSPPGAVAPARPLGAPAPGVSPPGAVARPAAVAPSPTRPAGPAVAPSPTRPAGPGIGARPGVVAPLGGAPKPAGAAFGLTPGSPGVGTATLPATRSPAATGLTGAFQKAAGTPPAPATTQSSAAATSHVPHGEDWYVGVGGVPLGPVRLAVIRDKALAGAVHADSLVWREGFDEWQPLKNFPELLEIVEEAQAARGGAVRRPSAVPPPPTRPSVLPPSRPPSVLPPAPAKAPAAAGGAAPGYQPKTTAIGLGLPAVTLPPKTAATLPSHGMPAVPPHTTKSAVTAPAAPAVGPRAGTVPPGGARPAPRPGESGIQASADLLGRPPAPTQPFDELGIPSPGPAPVASPSAASAEGAATDDLFGLGGGLGQAPAPAPVPAAALPAAALPAVAEPVAPAPAPEVAFAPAAKPAAPATLASAGALDVMRDPFAAPSKDVPLVSDAAGAALAPPVHRASSPSLQRASVEPPAPLSAPLSGEPEDVLPKRRQGMHPLAYAFIAMAAAFGAVVAFLLFSKPQQPTIVYVPQPGASTTGGAATTAAPGDTASAAPTVADAPSAEPSSGPKQATGGGPRTPATASTGTSAPMDTSGFVGSQVVPGPTATATNTADSTLGQLSAGEIQGVVASNQARIRKRCWQPALDSAGPNASGSARVKGRIVIGASGAVQSASASGAEKDYPGLSSCIAGQMQGWKFPPSSGTTPVDVPFVFAGQ